MRPFAVLDSETDPFKKGRIPKPFVWGFFDGKLFRHYVHDSFPDFIEWVKDQKIIVYAHNGGKFDYHFMLEYLAPYDDIKIINGRIAQFRIGKAEFRDSFNILPVRLATFELVGEDGETIKKSEIDYGLMEETERYKPNNWAEIIDYLRDDCITLYNAVAAFQALYGRHLTQAGAAMAQWKKISKLDVPRSTPDFFQQFKEFYYGGRVQCFRVGVIDEPFSVFDINSAYPYAMLSAHPYGTDFIRTETLDDAEEIGPCFIRIRCASTGSFPFREKTGLSFPEDGQIREFAITGWEYLAALETDTLHDYTILDVIYFSRLESFRDYIEHFYELRLHAKATGDKAMDLFAKLLMNSLYGKFGANPENYAEFLVLPPAELENLMEPDNEYSLSGEFGPWLLAEKGLEEDEMRYFNVATAASITGFVRAFLWRSICATGRDNIIYCDTDSIATMAEGHQLDTGRALGQWKHEGEFDRAGIGGKKMYIFRGKPDSKGKRNYKTASKGVKLTHNQLWKVARGQVVEYTPENPSFSVHSPPRFVSRRIRLTS